MIRNQELAIQLLSVLFPNATIYLFGSRARGDFKTGSDIDIAIDNKQRIDNLEIARALNVLEALNIPGEIDLVDMSRIPEAMKQNILNEGIIWKK